MINLSLISGVPSVPSQICQPVGIVLEVQIMILPLGNAANLEISSLVGIISMISCFKASNCFFTKPTELRLSSVVSMSMNPSSVNFKPNSSKV